jgi:hypothetical protein
MSTNLISISGIVPNTGGITTLCHVNHSSGWFYPVGLDRLLLPLHMYRSPNENEQGCDIWQVGPERRQFQRRLDPTPAVALSCNWAFRWHERPVALNQLPTHFVLGNPMFNELRLVDSTKVSGGELMATPYVPQRRVVKLKTNNNNKQEKDGMPSGSPLDDPEGGYLSNGDSVIYDEGEGRGWHWAVMSPMMLYPRSRRDADGIVRELQHMASSSSQGNGGNGNEHPFQSWPRDLLLVIVSYLTTYTLETAPPLVHDIHWDGLSRYT